MHGASHPHEHRSGGAVRWVFWAFALVGTYFLITEHRAHVYEYLPYVLLLACPLLHLFHGHGGHGRSEQHDHQSQTDKGDKRAGH
jgi:hypothetical protein